MFKRNNQESCSGTNGMRSLVGCFFLFSAVFVCSLASVGKTGTGMK